ncbi:MAG: UPF0489 family protein [Candidatus Omnitrophota bacterium]
MDISSLQDFYHGFYIDTPSGNNAFSYEARSCKKIFVPPFIKGDIHDVQSGERVVFSDIIDGVEVNARGLKQFVHMARPAQDIFIVDNHNHVFSCWAVGVEAGVIASGSTLVHVDQHRDVRNPDAWFCRRGDPCGRPNRGDVYDCLEEGGHKARPYSSDVLVRRTECSGEPAGASQALGERNTPSLVKTAAVYANEVLNVGNFIPPALKLGWFKDVVQVGSEDAFKEDIRLPFVLDIDLDIFAPIMDYIPQDYKIARLRHWMSRSSFITIATSPFFMDQKAAFKFLEQILSS